MLMKHLFMTKKLHQSGSIPILVLLILPLLLVMAGIGGDIGKLYVSKSELQSAADACALAAAAQFDGSANQTTKATTAGSAVALQNKVVFQKNAILGNDVKITFPTNLNGVPGTYAQCDVTRANITNWITPVLNIIGGNVAAGETISATAVATTLPGQTSCSIPVAICQDQLAGKNRGDWIGGIVSPQTNDVDLELEPGQFKWVDLSPENAGGANEIKNILNGSASTTCSVTATPDTTINKSGFNGGARKAFNTRFGLRETNNAPVPAVIPVTGRGYYTISGAPNPGRYDSQDYKNAVETNAPYTSINGIRIQPDYPSTVDDHRNFGKPDSRVVTTAVVDCSNMKLKSFACVFLLHPLPTTNGGGNSGGNSGGKGGGNSGGSSEPENYMYLEYLGNPATGLTPCNSSSFAGTGIGPRISALVQ